MQNNKIFLNDILKIDNLTKVKIRFNLMFDGNWNPIEIFKNNNQKVLLDGHYWNYRQKKSFKEGDTTIGLIRINGTDNLWLLFHIGIVTKDLNILDGMGYEYRALEQLEKYCGRMIIRYKNSVQALIRHADSVINECEVFKLLPDVFDNDIFPGYDRICISWEEMSRVLFKETWVTALQNQKGVYLICDKSNGKMYVGSAYGKDMILGRWQSYVANGHGGNVELKNLSFEHIKGNFMYSILDIFKAKTDDQVIIERESWWKNVFMTRAFGYNRN